MSKLTTCLKFVAIMGLFLVVTHCGETLVDPITSTLDFNLYPYGDWSPFAKKQFFVRLAQINKQDPDIEIEISLQPNFVPILENGKIEMPMWRIFEPLRDYFVQHKVYYYVDTPSDGACTTDLGNSKSFEGFSVEIPPPKTFQEGVCQNF